MEITEIILNSQIVDILGKYFNFSSFNSQIVQK